MSDEIVHGPHGKLYVISGDPSAGYTARAVGWPLGSHPRKYELRRAIRDGDYDRGQPVDVDAVNGWADDGAVVVALRPAGAEEFLTWRLDLEDADLLRGVLRLSVMSQQVEP
jgi:hypothetical protein